MCSQRTLDTGHSQGDEFRAAARYCHMCRQCVCYIQCKCQAEQFQNTQCEIALLAHKGMLRGRDDQSGTQAWHRTGRRHFDESIGRQELIFEARTLLQRCTSFTKHDKTFRLKGKPHNFFYHFVSTVCFILFFHDVATFIAF